MCHEGLGAHKALVIIQHTLLGMGWAISMVIGGRESFTCFRITCHPLKIGCVLEEVPSVPAPTIRCHSTRALRTTFTEGCCSVQSSSSSQQICEGVLLAAPLLNSSVPSGSHRCRSASRASSACHAGRRRCTAQCAYSRHPWKPCMASAHDFMVIQADSSASRQDHVCVTSIVQTLTAGASAAAPCTRQYQAPDGHSYRLQGVVVE